MRVLLQILSVLGLAVAIQKNGLHPSHGYHLHKLQVDPTSLPPHGYANAMNHTMEIELHAGGFVVTLDLRLKTNQWGTGAEIVTEVDANGKTTKTMPLFHRSYTGKAFVKHVNHREVESGSVSVTFFPDDRFTALVVTEHDIYDVSLNEFIFGQFPLTGKDAGHRMHVSRFTDMKLGEAHAEEHARDPMRHRIRKYLNAKPGGRRLNQLIPFDNCFTGQSTTQKAIRMALVADPAFYGLKTGQSGTPTITAAHDSTVVAAMISILNRASDTIYSPQLRIWLLAGKIMVGQASASSPMAGGSFARKNGRGPSACTEGGGSLKVLKDYRKSHYGSNKDNNALWHMLTDCHPPAGTVGIAYVGVICNTVYGVGWSSFTSSAGTWMVFAHEVGHNFGAPHSFDNGQGKTGGIMDYGDGYYPAPTPSRSRAPNAAIAFNPLRKNDVCGELTGAMTSRSRSNIPPQDCFTVYQSAPSPQPSTPRPTTPKPTTRPTSRPTSTPKPTTSTPKPTTTPQPTTTPRPTTPAPTPSVPVITFKWVLKVNAFTPCSPSCGNNMFKRQVFECQESKSNPGSNTPTTRIVADNNCEELLKPPGTPVKCPPVQCGATCGDGKVSGAEVCDPGNDPNSCCASDCLGYKQSYNCLAQNKLIDGAFMTCQNDVQNSDCFVYLFQGEYFNKYYAVPGFPFFYANVWSGARKYQGVLHNNAAFSSLSAIGGGRNGQVWAFNGFNYMKIDFRDENQGKVLETGNVKTDWGIAPDFAACGKVTAADIMYEVWMLLFCDQIYTWVNIVDNKGIAEVYPAGDLFGNGLDTGVGVNAFFYDQRYRQIRIFRGDIQSSFIAEGMQSSGNATVKTIFGTGSSPVIDSGKCHDPECKSCNSPTDCTSCNPKYKVQVGRCVPEKILVDMTFKKGSKTDVIYSKDSVLQTATFVADHGGFANSAMVFTPTTRVIARAPGMSGKTIQNFRVEAFYKPYSVNKRQTFVTIDDRVTVALTAVNGTTMKLWVMFDKMSFDCYVMKPLTLNKWNLIAVEFAAKQIITSVNGFEHNRAYQQVAGGPTLGLSFQNVTIGAVAGGIDGELDTFAIEEVPVTILSRNANVAAVENAWVTPVAIIGTLFGLCVIGGLIFLCYRRGLCGREEKNSGSNDAHTAFLAASGETETGGNYERM